MDPAAEVRADLRSYALRRCIRFYSSLLLLAIVVVGAQLVDGEAEARTVLQLGAALFAVLAVVEAASGVVMLQMALVRSGHPGEESPLWLFAQGQAPSWLATLLFLGVAGGLFILRA